MPVHHHLAGDYRHVALFRRCEERLSRLRMHGAINGSRGRAMRRQRVEKMPRDAAAMLRIGEFGLLRKGVFLQPVEQLGAPGGNDLHLRVMRMRIDEAGHNQMRAMIDDLRPVCFQRREIRTFGDPAVPDPNTAILDIAERSCVIVAGRLVPEAENPASQDEIGHHCTTGLSPSNQRTICALSAGSI